MEHLKGVFQQLLCVSVCLSVWLCVWFFEQMFMITQAHVCLSVCLYLSVCMCVLVCLFLCLCICLSVCLCVFLSLSLILYLYVCLSVSVVLDSIAMPVCKVAVKSVYILIVSYTADCYCTFGGGMLTAVNCVNLCVDLRCVSVCPSVRLYFCIRLRSRTTSCSNTQSSVYLCLSV